MFIFWRQRHLVAVIGSEQGELAAFLTLSPSAFTTLYGSQLADPDHWPKKVEVPTPKSRSSPGPHCRLAREGATYRVSGINSLVLETDEAPFNAVSQNNTPFMLPRSRPATFPHRPNHIFISMLHLAGKWLRDFINKKFSPQKKFSHQMTAFEKKNIY